MTEEERCCARHHYTCFVGDDYPPEPCCPACPGIRMPQQLLPLHELEESP